MGAVEPERRKRREQTELVLAGAVGKEVFLEAGVLHQLQQIHHLLARHHFVQAQRRRQGQHLQQ